MPSMYDMMYGNSTPNAQQGYGGGSSPWGMLSNLQRPNTQAMQYGLQMMQPRPAGAAQMPIPYGGGGGQQPQVEPLPQYASPDRKRRIRIGGKVYVEEDSAPQAAPQAPPQAPPQGGGY